MNINQIARSLTSDPNIINESHLVDPRYSQYHPHVFTMVMQMPKSFHPNRPMALVEFEYIAGGGPEAYSTPEEAGAVNVLRIVAEGYKMISPQALSEQALEELVKIGYEAIRDADENEIYQSRGEHEVW